MKKPTVEEVLQQGIYGTKEIKPEERRQFLGTLRERVLAVLKKNQVREQDVYPQIGQLLKENPTAHLLLNGTLPYRDLSKYVKIAKKCKASYTIVTNKEHDTEIGLVLAVDHAIDKEEIYLGKTNSTSQTKAKSPSFLAKLFKRG
ncbi:YueI family protein [Neobacillus sp. SM06]|uniref:YueI family protein n=1 Tax=Neobacillus sp. SM06 TaxID=3422492 RepID=UPI003D2AE4BF